MSQEKTKPIKIASYSYAGNQAFSISLMQTDNIYEPFFLFLSLTPGETAGKGERTFNYKNSVTLKVSPTKINELSYALSAYARGQAASIGKFSIFTDSSKSSSNDNNETKSFSLTAFKDEKAQEPRVMMSAKTNQMSKAISLPLTVPAALALSDICKKFFEKAIDMTLNMSSNNGLPIVNIINKSENKVNSFEAKSNHPKLDDYLPDNPFNN